ncbi:MAG: DUF2306 domain-containing protein [Verrucomicrobiota bacterium]
MQESQNAKAQIKGWEISYPPLAVACKAMMATIWFSAALFGAYILAFYAGNWLAQKHELWNTYLPELYDAKRPVSTVGMGVHFAGGGIILILGCIQIMNGVRERWPRFHRITGRIYLLACLLTTLGGLTFIFTSGTIGGPVMDVGFVGYGICMMVATVETARHAIKGRFDAHRAWALRLFALAIGSWLYRMYYGFWFLLFGKWLHTPDFRGLFDFFMSYWFYIPNLLVVQAILGRGDWFRSQFAQRLTTVLLSGSTLFLILGTYFFGAKIWLPKIFYWFM